MWVLVLANRSVKALDSIAESLRQNRPTSRESPWRTDTTVARRRRAPKQEKTRTLQVGALVSSRLRSTPAFATDVTSLA